MSETLQNRPETQEAWQPTPEQLPALPTAELAEPLRPGEADPRQRLEQARQTVEQAPDQDNPLDKLKTAEKAAEPSQPRYINRELKAITLRRELKQLQRKLPFQQRVASKLIHQGLIRKVSEPAAKTISRPSGLLGGGLVAFLGTSSYLYMAKHLGFRYNYLVFLVLFAAGFALGLLLEFVVYVATTSRRRVSE